MGALLQPIVVLLNSVLVFSISNPVDYVNILGGTSSRYDLSHGNTLPLITRPWGFNSYAPKTDDDSSYKSWWFHPEDRRFYGIRVTHQPSPWIRDYGNFLIKASVPNILNNDDLNDYSGYSPQHSTFAPYLFKTSLLAYGTKEDEMSIEFSASNHGGIMRAKYPASSSEKIDAGYVDTRRITIVLNGGEDESTISSSVFTDGTTVITGSTTANSGGASNFRHYFVAAIYGGADGTTPVKGISSNSSSNGAYVDFDALQSINSFLTIRFATSFISIEQAMTNLEAECGVKKSFDDLVSESKQEWYTLLSRIDIQQMDSSYSTEEKKDKLTTFYSALYRSSIFPRLISETTKDGEVVHWSPYDGKIHSGPVVTDSGFWDAYSTVYPLHSLWNQNQLSVMINGWLNSYKEGGWLPKWASPGYRSGMVGTMGDVTIADAIVKNIPGFDREMAYEAIRKDAFEIPPTGVNGVGRVCLEAYLNKGYIPVGSLQTTGGPCSETVSRTMNYMQSDFAIAQAAKALGHEEDAVELMYRAGNYSLLFDNSDGFFKGKLVVTGKFVSPFDQFAWGGEYTEGGPWQYKFYVPYDPVGLAKLYAKAGVDMCDELHSAQTMRSTFHIGLYGTEIHEQTELPENCWGQYAHNNQPVHHMLYMFGGMDSEGYTGQCAARGQYWLRKAVNELYHSGTDMFAGDEDNGQMSAWYVLSSLGLYSLSPGTTEYVFGSPLFSRVVMELDPQPTIHTKKLIISCVNNSKTNVYIKSIRWNGELLEKVNSISFNKLMEGGHLQFEMTA